MGRTSIPKVVGYRCTGCGWIAETRTIPNRCGRCRRVARVLQLLSSRELIELIDRGEARFCEPCGCLHCN